MEGKMIVAVSSLGTSLDAWAGVAFGACSQFLVVDSETYEFVVVTVPAERRDPEKVSLYAIRAVARQGAQVVITGAIKPQCKQAMVTLGMDVIEGIEHMTVREALERYVQGGAQAVVAHARMPERIAVASHGDSLDSPLAPQGEPCTSFVLVDPETMGFDMVRIEPADSLAEGSVHAVRAAAGAGATAVITSGLRPECCMALSALAISVFVAEPGTTVREAIVRFKRGELAQGIVR
jgi:predicted Fe-Mo cluster-binding NifX family protein